jgi:molecular chaperone DnaJ
MAVCFNFLYSAFAQNESSKNLNELVISDVDLIIIFSSFISSVIAIFLYLARHQILRKKLEYDLKDYESKKNKDYEKYHSDWTEDEFVGKKSFSKYDEEFRKLKQSSSFPDYYNILGIPKDSTQNEIKNQFRRLVKEWHPDKNPDPKTKEKMAEINKAYEVLSDKERRSNYDKYFDSL